MYIPLTNSILAKFPRQRRRQACWGWREVDRSIGSRDILAEGVDRVLECEVPAAAGKNAPSEAAEMLLWILHPALRPPAI